MLTSAFFLSIGTSIEMKMVSVSTPIDDLLIRVNAWLVEDCHADESVNWIETKNTLAAQLAQAVQRNDFSAVSILGMKLLAHQENAAQLIVSEEKYHSLPERRAQLIAALKMECLMHIKTNQFDTVGQLSSALDAMYVTAERYQVEDCGALETPAEAVTLSLNSINTDKGSPSGNQDHTSPTSVAELPVLSALVPSADPTPWDPCYVPSPRAEAILSGKLNRTFY